MNTFTSAAGYHVYALAASEADSHWVLLLSAMLLSAVACSLIMAAAHTVLPLMAPETYRAMVAEKACQRVAVPKNVTEWWPAIVTPLLVYSETRELTLAALAAPEQALYLPAGPAMWSATGAALGYMVYDCGVMAVFRGALRESMGGEMYNLLWFHHVFSLVFWPYALHSSAACVFVAWFLLSEVTNVFLNCRTLLIKMRKTSGAPFMIVRAPPAQLTAAPAHAPASVPASTPGTVPPPPRQPARAASPLATTARRVWCGSGEHALPRLLLGGAHLADPILRRRLVEGRLGAHHPRHAARDGDHDAAARAAQPLLVWAGAQGRRAPPPPREEEGQGEAVTRVQSRHAPC